jgi:hypothetical protein
MSLTNQSQVPNICSMNIRRRNDGSEAVHDTTEDRDLIAMINEARDPLELDRITVMARARTRARRRDADAAAAPRPSRRRAHLFGRMPSFRQHWGY